MRNRRSDAPTRRVDLLIDPEVVIEVDVFAARHGCSRSAAVEALLRVALNDGNTRRGLAAA